MKEAQPRAIHLKDYAPPAFRVETIDLDVDIREARALVAAKLEVRRNAAGPLVLDGDELELVSVTLNGSPVRHEVTPEKLTIPDVPDAFTLETVSRIVPQKNTKLEGLYATKHGFVTQCEAQGFRRITWFTDRPVRLGDRIGISVGEDIKLVGPHSVRTVRPKGVPCLVAASGSRLFLYGRTSWSGRFDQCDGVTGLDRKGAVRFRAMDSEDVVDLQFGRSYAYAWTDDDIAVLDLRRARVVKRIPESQSRLVLLLPPSRSTQLGDW